ncbi:type I 3-dehydroquinate dehydratase [soil metagenome]
MINRMSPNFKPINFNHPPPPYVVAPIATPHVLDAHRGAGAAPDCDLLEFRIDGLLEAGDRVGIAMAESPVPTLLTVRRPDEGGLAPGLDTPQRIALYRAHLASASLIDIESRSLEDLAEVVSEAAAEGVGVVASMHDFEGMPSQERIGAAISAAAAAGACVFKLAATPRDMPETMELVGLLCRPWPLAMAVMGMGAFGRISRLMAIRAGSALNYGYLLAPNAQGQWPAAQLRSLARDLFE